MNGNLSDWGSLNIRTSQSNATPEAEDEVSLLLKSHYNASLINLQFTPETKYVRWKPRPK